MDSWRLEPARDDGQPRLSLSASTTPDKPGSDQVGILPGQVEELWSGLDTARRLSQGPSSLSTAELRLLPWLSTHLSFREIGERLYLSQHTVKSQAISVYRKLSVSSRSQAVQRLQEIGLIGYRARDPRPDACPFMPSG
jgi:DNA-binding CsgD family transcriptional regulator